MPSERCGSCRKFISPVEGIRCLKCNLLQHRSCVAIPTKANVAATWKCPDCRRGEARDNREDTPVQNRSLITNKDTSDTSLSVNNPTHTVQLENIAPDCTNREIMEEIRAMRREMRNLQHDISDMKIEIRTCLVRVDGFEARLEALEKRVSIQNESPTEISTVITQLRSDLNDRDQDILANDVEIRNIPEEKDENPTQLVIAVAAGLGVNLENRDIVSAERFGGRFLNTNEEETLEPRSRALIVRLARRDLRDDLLQKARIRHTTDVGNVCYIGSSGKSQRFFINERLTKFNRQLFWLAREVGRKNNWQFIWTRRGRILARRKPGDPVVRIRVKNDIIENIGPITDTI
ncbi:hypothetical protein K1T71_007153 [Dendrolimus kikuchii]|uniref:Uncharacterized protein n=1 Tax=Dendrolimus kikuchii TaxID=765133 RepID=A0ACC1D094_9NEOP|nr:hypothetical protein K1T71_007153 [Dendrolimus kikuchii]